MIKLSASSVNILLNPPDYPFQLAVFAFTPPKPAKALRFELKINEIQYFMPVELWQARIIGYGYLHFYYFYVSVNYYNS